MYFLASQPHPSHYRGYVHDAETGFYYLQSRYYDPEICRFVNADTYASTGQGVTGHNMFAYCLNNPIVFGDDNGEWVHIAAGAAIGWGVSFFSTLITNGSIEDALISGAFGMVSGAVTAACPAAGVWVDAGLAVAESIVLDCKNSQTENITPEEMVTNAAISCGVALLPFDDFFSSKAFSNEVSIAMSSVKTLNNGTKTSTKPIVNNYFKKWKKEALFAFESYVCIEASKSTMQETTKVCIRLMVQEGLI